jgi:predicted nucleic acid-binding protein
VPDALLYLDASALVKLVVREAESAALSSELMAWPAQVSSIISEVEVPRAARRASLAAEAIERAERVVRQLGTVFLTEEVARGAAMIAPLRLRSLDAIHLASALSLGPNLGAFVSYDRRLAEAAESAGLETLAPA